MPLPFASAHLHETELVRRLSMGPPRLRPHVSLPLSLRRSRRGRRCQNVNEGSEFFNIACHYHNGEVSRAFWGWNAATAIAVSCFSLSPIRRIQIWPTFSSGVGLIQSYAGAVGLDSTAGATWTTGPLRDGRPHALTWILPLCLTDGSFVLLSPCTSCHRFLSSDCSQTDSTDFLAVMWSTSSTTHTETCGLTCCFPFFCVSFPQLFFLVFFPQFGLNFFVSHVAVLLLGIFVDLEALTS